MTRRLEEGRSKGGGGRGDRIQTCCMHMYGYHVQPSHHGHYEQLAVKGKIIAPIRENHTA